MRFTAKKKGELDWGAFYAPKTQVDAQGRRILWGWVQEQRNEAAMKSAGWSGMMSLPRVLSLDDDGTLRMEILPEMETLRAGKLPDQEIRAGVCRVLPRATGEVLCTGIAGRAFTVTIGDGEAELVKISYEPASHTMHADGRAIALEAGDRPVIHAYVDGSVVELVLGERVGLTKRFYYANSVGPDIVVVGDGNVSMEGWRMKAISEDRLTR
jgi:beta-fructofuranosidase